MKKTILFILTSCLLLCACSNPNSATTTLDPLPEVTIVATAKAIPTITSTPSPTVAPTVEPILAPTKPSFEGWDIEDNGIDGVGIIRGNTNGNYATGGRAVDTGDTIYYIVSPADPLEAWLEKKGKMQLLAYDKISETEVTLLNEEFFIEDLNWDGKLLWFTRSPNIQDFPREIWTFNPNTGEMQIAHERGLSLLIAYDVAFIGWYFENSEIGTICLDINTREVLYVHEHFRVISAMDGWLYGYDGGGIISDKFYKMRPDGTKKSKCAPVNVAVDGKLYFYDRYKEDKHGFPLESSLKLMITDAKSGKTINISFDNKNKEFDAFINVSHELIYLRDYKNEEIYTLNLDGTKLTLVPRAAFRAPWGNTLINGELIGFIIPEAHS